MSAVTIDETCACGARMQWTGDSAYAKSAAAAFREQHQHAPAIEPGLCWAEGGVMWPNGITPRCELRAGHDGAHECGRGSMGGTAVWTEPETTEEPPC